MSGTRVHRRDTVLKHVLLWLLLASGGLAMPAHGACLNSSDPVAAALDDEVTRDPKEARRLAQAQLDRSGATELRRRAGLLAIQAQSDSMLELDAEARLTASAGLALVKDLKDPLHAALLSVYAENVYEADGMERAVEAIRSTRQAQTPGSAADLCLQVTLGSLQHRQDRTAEAVVTLTQAYRASAAPQFRKQRVAAAAELAAVMRSAGDYKQALELNQEVIDWDNLHDASMDLSVNQYLRGSILHALAQYPEAIVEFSKAGRLSEMLGDEQGIAFTQMSICEAHIEIGQLQLARRECDDAANAFAMSKSNDVFKQSQALLARIDLAEGNAHAALIRLNRVLDHAAADLPQRQVGAIYHVRARAYAATGDFHAAFDDISEYLRRYTSENDQDRRLHAVIQRARFETDRQIERNASLQHELKLSEENSARRTQQLRLTVIIIAIGSIGIALLIYILLTNLRYRRVLVRLAEQDGLTGLPNRRHVTNLAQAALNAAVSTGRPVTIGLLDLDHFKNINDRCGHAVGDRVLTEFAELGRGLLRAGDVLGRWGGEEFLLVLPATALDAAVEATDRLRAAALRIELPESAGGLHVTFSAGLATDRGFRSLDQIIGSADAALYLAKNQGRNAVLIDQESLQSAATGVRLALQFRHGN
ncbi:MAG: GGDEF domain-containing protein [Pseudomonadota bacterium]|nr:GGDEF domain-containing protein [Pseudomonadota bacterium]